MSLCLLIFSSAALSSKERLKKVGVRIEIKFIDVTNWSSGGVHFDFQVRSISKRSLSKLLESSSLSWKKAFS